MVTTTLNGSTDHLYYIWDDSTNTLTIRNNITTNGVIKSFANGRITHNNSGISNPMDLRTRVKHVIIEEGITGAETLPFSGCSVLEDVSFPSTITLWAHTFENCVKLSSVVFPAGITTIPDSMFYGCTSLITITIPDTVTTIDHAAFRGCAMMTTVTISSSSSLTHINTTAFMGCTRLTTISFPSTLTVIDEQAFSGDTSLTTVELPASVTTVGYSAFYGCTSITLITLNSVPTTIDLLAFSLGTNTKSVSCIVWSPSNIANGALESYKGSYTTFEYLATGSYRYTGSDGLTYFLNGNTLTISGTGAMTSLSRGTLTIAGGSTVQLRGETSCIIESGVTSIGVQAFYNANALTSISIPSSVTEIKSEAFLRCGSLTSIQIPASVTTLGSGVLRFCTSLTAITVDGSNTTYCSDDGVLFNNDKTTLMQYPAGKVGTTYTVPTSVTTIDSGAFAGCVNLTSVVIPDNVTTINGMAFEECSVLTSVTLPQNLTVLNARLFYRCMALTTVNIPSGVTEIQNLVFYQCTSLTTLSIPNTVTAIGTGAFEFCSSLQSITIPTGVTAIEERTFYGCSSLTSITIPNSVTSIGAWAFRDCSGLTEIALPLNLCVTGTRSYALGNGKAWAGCTNIVRATITASSSSAYDYSTDSSATDYYQDLPWYVSRNVFTTLTVDNGCVKIPNYAFKDCTNLSIVSLPNTITTIGQYAFDGCTSVAVNIASSVTSIGDYAFNGTSIRNVDLSNISSLGSNAFKDCTNLKSLTVHASRNLVTNTPFIGCTGIQSVTLLPGQGVDYTESNHVNLPWYQSRNSFTTLTLQFEAGNPSTYVSKIGDYTFAGCSSLNTLVLNSVDPYQLTTYGQHAFDGCSSLSSVDLSAATSIGNYAFQGSDLRNISTSSSATFGNYVFKDCTNLASATIYYESIYTPGTKVGTFEGCTRLSSVTINFSTNPTSAPIPSRTFYGCTSLRTVPWNLHFGRIGESAFENSGILSIDLTGLTEIDDNAFKNCLSLHTITFQRSCSIGDSAFEGCSNVSSVDFKGTWVTPITLGAASFSLGTEDDPVTAVASSVGNWAEDYLTGTTIGDYTEFIFISPEVIGNDGLTYSFSNGCMTVTNTGSTSVAMSALSRGVLTPQSGNPINVDRYVMDVVIEERINLVSGTLFGGALSQRGTVVLGEDLVTVGYEAFLASKFQTVKYLANAITFGPSAFRNSTIQSLKAIAYDQSDNEIFNTSAEISAGTQSFEGCTGLTNTSEMGRFQAIGDFAFRGCTGITSIDSGDTTAIRNGAFYGCSSLRTLTLNEGLLTIGAGAFTGCAVETLSIPDSLTSIGNMSFSGCASLRTVSIGEGVSSIGEEVFAQCPSIEQFSVDAGNVPYVAYNDALYLTNGSLIRYPPAKSSTSVTFLPDTYVIEGTAFEDAVHLTGIELPDTLYKIGNGAFRGCVGLTSISIPEGVSNFGGNVFAGCYSLTSVTFNRVQEVSTVTSSSFLLGDSEHEVTCTVYSPNNWVSDTVNTENPNNYTTLIFIGLYYIASDGLTYRKYLDDDNRKVLSITIPAGSQLYAVASMNSGRVETTSGNYVDFSDMEIVLLDSGITELCDWAFRGCTELKSIYLPVNMTHIGSYAFMGCVSLTAINLPIGLTALGTSVFAGCISLTKIYIPQNITFIGADAFKGCYSIIKIVFLGNRPDTIQTEAFALGTSEHPVVASVQSRTGWTLEEV